MSMEMMANIAQPQWKLDELPALLEQRMEERIDSVSQLNLYMQRNEADLIYGSRLIAQIEAILREIRKAGLNRDVAVATESLRPGTIPKAVQSVLTSNYSKTHQKETVVALESYANFGKISLIVMVMMGIMKILSWIISNAVPFAGAANIDGNDYREKLEEKLADVPFTGRLKTTVLKEVYLVLSKGLKDSELSNLELSLSLADDVFVNMEAEEFLNKLAAALGKSPFIDTFKNHLKRRQNELQVIQDLLDTLLRTNIGYGVFDFGVAEEVYNGLPPDVKRAGVNIPSDTQFNLMSMILDSFARALQDLDQSLKDIKTYYLSNNPKVGTQQENQVAAVHLVRALGEINGRIEFTATEFGRQKGSPGPILRVKDKVELLGYTTRELDNGWMIASVGVNSFFGSTTNLEMMRQELSLSNGDYRELLACLITLARSGISDGVANTALDKYKVLEKRVDQVVKTLKEMARQSRSGVDAEKWQAMEQAFKDQVTRRENFNIHGRELTTMMVLNPDRNVWDSVAHSANMINMWCKAAGSMATVLKRAKSNPLVKGGKFNKLVD